MKTEKETGIKCERCSSNNATRRAQMTNYANIESNFATLCEECQEEMDAYWEYKWEECYGSCLYGQ